MPSEFYIVEIYLPHPINETKLVLDLRKQWSLGFGGTASFSTQGTYMEDDPEAVTIIKLYVPKKYDRQPVIAYFEARKDELAQRFPDQEEFLITFQDGPVLFL